MKFNTKYLLLFIILTTIIAPLIFFQLTPKQEKPTHDTTVNKKILQTKSFRVNSISTPLDTSAEGTVFIKGEEGIVELIRIVTSVKIDSNDWGGVAIHIPNKWYISNVTSSYPEDKDHLDPKNFTTTWTANKDESDWNSRVEIGRNRDYKPTGGGSGTVVVDIVPDKNEIQQSESFEISVSVGSDENNGTKIFDTDSINIPISIDAN